MRKSFLTGEFKVRFSGNMIGFVNALWTGFEIVEQKQLPDNRFEVDVKLRNATGINDLMQALMGQVEIESIEVKTPSMHDVFLKAIQTEINH